MDLSSAPPIVQTHKLFGVRPWTRVHALAFQRVAVVIFYKVQCATRSEIDFTLSLSPLLLPSMSRIGSVVEP